MIGYKDLPNLLSLSRVAMAVVFPLLPWSFRVGLLFLAAVTEFLDGFLARRWNAESLFGRLLDPAADKLFASSVGLTLVAAHHIRFPELVLVLSRDIVIVIGCLYFTIAGHAERLKDFYPNGFGKWATATQYVFFYFALQASPLEIPFMVVASFFSLAAAFKYVRDISLLIHISKYH